MESELTRRQVLSPGLRRVIAGVVEKELSLIFKLGLWNGSGKPAVDAAKRIPGGREPDLAITFSRLSAAVQNLAPRMREISTGEYDGDKDREVGFGDSNPVSREFACGWHFNG
jgi:hypothetical protein